VASRSTEPSQVRGRCARVDDVLQHLLADDQVVAAGICFLELGAEIEIREVERGEGSPCLGGVVGAADLGCPQTGRVE